MEYIILQSFTNYLDAHILKGRLEESGIDCWLKDEYLVTIDPILTNAVGGIKVMVPKERYQEALDLVKLMDGERRSRLACPNCGSRNIEFVSTPRKLSNWIGALAGTLMGNYAIGTEKVWKCFTCGTEFETPTELNNNESSQ